MKQSVSRTIRSRGLSLPEVLISMSICGMLMTAVTGAFMATTQAVEENSKFFRAAQTARVTLTQLMAEARKCRSGVVDPTSFEIVTAMGETREYNYDAANRQLTMTPHVGLPPWGTYVVARDIESAAFASSNGTVSLTLTVATGRSRVTFTSAATLRKAMSYD
ncbi:MAG TPA: type II secretion system protein [Tepidisphaeraceae bacterium]|jgi:prepilin-type N-terminal cleavage/methylation domain-containing protein